MKSNFKTLFFSLLFIPLTYAQKNQIKAAQKELKAGNSEQVVEILSPVEYLINNASDEEKIHFYYIKGTALLDLANKNINSSKNLSQAVTAFNDLIETEKELNKYKYTSEAKESLKKIKDGLVKCANDDFATENFTDSSNKYYQAYIIDKRDTLQLYKAAMSFKNAGENDLALNCFEELKTINYSGNTVVYIAYNKNKLIDENFGAMNERDTQIQNGTHIRPRQEIQSKKAEICKNIALIYVQSGYKEKAIKAISQARKLDSQNLSLAVVEANLYLETKDYDYFDNLASVIIESNPNNAEIVTNFGINCQNEKYYDGAEYYFKTAIEIDPKYTKAYLGLSSVLVEKSLKITELMNDLGSSPSDKKIFADLKDQKEQILKRVFPYLQKVVCIDPFNSSIKQLVSSMNMTNINYSSGVLASGE